MIQRLVYLNDGYRVEWETGKVWRVSTVDPKEEVNPTRAAALVDYIANRLLESHLLDPSAIPMTPAQGSKERSNLR